MTGGVGHTGGLTSPRPWLRRGRVGYSNTGAADEIVYFFIRQNSELKKCQNLNRCQHWREVSDGKGENVRI